MILSGLVSRIGSLLVADYRLVHSSLFLEERSQGILGATNSSLGRLTKPKLGFFIIWKNTQPILPSPAQMVRCHRKTIVPHLLQRLQCLPLLCLSNVIGIQCLHRLAVVQHCIVVTIPKQDVRIFFHHVGIFEGENVLTQIFSFLNHQIFDGPELPLLRERQVLPGRILVVALQVIPQLVPGGIALRHCRDIRQLVHDVIHLSLGGFFQVAVYLSALGCFQGLGQCQHLRTNF